LHGNPVYPAEHSCQNNTCVPDLYDEDGRLTYYARSQRPEMFSLDFDRLPKLHPEEYGNNYYEPGAYVIHPGDGFGKFNYLIKFMEFIPQGEGVNGQVIFEVFRKEADGNYYHFPTSQHALSRYSYTDIFDIVIESPDYSWQINPEENTLIYHSTCTVFYEYCDQEESSGHYANGDTYSCVQRCKFDAYDGEEKVEHGIHSAIYPAGYTDLAEFTIKMQEECYESNIEFLGYDVRKPRLGTKLYLGNSVGLILAEDETLTARTTESYLDNMREDFDGYEDMATSNGCTYFMRMSHELTHLMTNEVLGNNSGLIEGIAEFVEFQNNASQKTYLCEETGWSYPYWNETRDYANLSTSINEGLVPSSNYYATGFCFWKDFTYEYGYPNFVLLMQELQQRGRGIDDFYVLDVMEGVIGEPVSEEILDRYSLTRESTFVHLCYNCEMFMQ